MERPTSGPAASLATITVEEGVGHLQLANARERNALSLKLRQEVCRCLDTLGADPEVRCVVFSAAGEVFCAGIDLQELGMLSSGGDVDPGRRALVIAEFVRGFQDFISAFERCPKPVVCAVHGPCIGGGLNLITACDLRLCSASASFSLREARVGGAADVGGLQRLPKIVGCDSWVRYLAYTGRDFGAEEALRHGLVQEVLPTAEALAARAVAIAHEIAANSPLAVAATKASLTYSRDHSVADGLLHVALLNQANLQGPDLRIGVQAFQKRQQPKFANLVPTSKL